MAQEGLTALAVAAALAACAKGEAPPPARASQTMHEFSMAQTAKGARIWALDAPRATVALDGSALLESPEIRFYRGGRHASTARSRQAVVRGDGKDVSLIDDVVITAIRDKTTLRTSRLDYSAQTERFRTEEAVTVERPDALLKGKGLEADATLTDITIYRQQTLIRGRPGRKG